MKKIFLLSFVFAMLSCFSDKGTYDYMDINEVTFEGLEKEYAILKGTGNLVIPVTIVSSKETESTASYSYKWTIGDRIISTDKDLNFDVDLDRGNYTLYFKVKDNKTGVEWKTSTTLFVTFAINKGFNLACEDKDGYLQVDMLAFTAAGDTLVLSDIAKENGMPAIKGATKVVHTGKISNVNNVKFWAIGGDGAYYMDINSLRSSPYNKMQSLIYTSKPIPEDLRLVDIAPESYNGQAVGSSTRFAMCNNGWIFIPSNMIGDGDIYANPMSYITSENHYFKTAPYFMYARRSLYGFVVYDTEKDRFVFAASSTAPSLTALSDGANDIFPWQNSAVERTLRYAENTRNTDGGSSNGNSFVLMQSKDNTSHWIYKFYAYRAPQKRGFYEVRKDLATGIGSTSIYAFSSQRTVMFYAVEDKLYAYDYNVGNERIHEIDFGNTNGDKITMLKFDLQSSAEFNDLYIATYNSTTGGTLRKVVLDVVDPNTVKVTLDEKDIWTGFAKIKNMDYRND